MAGDNQSVGTESTMSPKRVPSRHNRRNKPSSDGGKKIGSIGGSSGGGSAHGRRGSVGALRGTSSTRARRASLSMLANQLRMFEAEKAGAACVRSVPLPSVAVLGGTAASQISTNSCSRSSSLCLCPSLSLSKCRQQQKSVSCCETRPCNSSVRQRHQSTGSRARVQVHHFINHGFVTFNAASVSLHTERHRQESAHG